MSGIVPKTKKKTATVKLPLPKKKPPVSTASVPVQSLARALALQNSDSDDDFQLPAKPINTFTSPKKIQKQQQDGKMRINKPSSTVNPSVSEYFTKDQGRSSGRKGANADLDSDEDSDSSPSVSSISIQAPVPKNTNKAKAKPAASCKVKLPLPKKVVKQSEKESSPPYEPEEKEKPEIIIKPEPEETEAINDANSKVVCPFCWKQLGDDKLKGTVHVKSCAKNLPTNQIFEALQLQEKQIKEWEELGIAYPAFKGGAEQGGKATRRPARTGGGTSRKKKVDPELELAIALSESLHEEVARRKKEENHFIVENNLEGVVELHRQEEIATIANSKNLLPVEPARQVTKRGKKVNIHQLPLFTASEQTKKAEIEKRLNQILDEAQTPKETSAFVRDEPCTKSLKVPLRLETHLEPEQKISLWRLADCSSNSDDPKIFTIKDVSLFRSRSIAVKESEQKQKVSDTENSSTSPNKEKPLEYDAEPEPSTIRNRTSEENPSSRALSVPKVLVRTDNERRVDEQDVFESSDSISTEGSRPLQSCELRLIEDLLRIFANKVDVDLTVYGKEEKPIRCHKLIIKARCPRLFNEIVQETTSKGVRKDVIALTCFSHAAVKAFIKFLYCGRLKKVSGQDLLDLQELGTKYRVSLFADKNEAKENCPAVISNAGGSASSPILFKQETNRKRSKASRKMKNIETEQNEDCGIVAVAERKSSDDKYCAPDQETADSNDLHIIDSHAHEEYKLHQEEEALNGSFDMFEDFPDDAEAPEETHNPTEFKNGASNEIGDNIESSGKQGFSQFIADMYEDLLSPVKTAVLFSPEPYITQKRCRNISQDSFFGSQDENNGQQPSSTQANKKLKFHNPSDDFDVESASNNCVHFDLDKDTNRHHEIDNDVLVLNGDDFGNSINCEYGHSTPIKKTSQSSSRKLTTPIVYPFSNPVSNSNPTKSASVSPTCGPSLQNGENAVFQGSQDPFGDDDSCFLNMPSVILPDQNVEAVADSLFRNDADTNTQTRGRPKTKKTVDPGKKKGGKGKQRSLSQEPTPTRALDNPHESTPLRKKSNSNMLDYSTIDTPILKKELKKYGLKPLARSKAKLILRHIVQETGKT